MTEAAQNPSPSNDRDSEFRKLEREWQNRIGRHLSDGPHEAIGSSEELHRLIDYPSALSQAYRVLRPGGRPILFEPMSLVLTRVVHHILDLLVLTGCYSDSALGHWRNFMRSMLRVEKMFEAVLGLRSIASFFNWRFLLVAEK